MTEQATQNFLNPNVREALLSDDVFREYEDLTTSFGLESDRAVPVLSSRVLAFVSGDLEPAAFQRSLQLDFLLSTQKAREFISRLFLHVLSPIADQVSGLRERMAAWQEQAGASGERMTPDAFITFFLTPFADAFEPVVLHRLENLLTDDLHGQRTRGQTIEFLQRPYKLGGMAFDAAQASEMMESFDLKRRSVVVEQGAANTPKDRRGPQPKDRRGPQTPPEDHAVIGERFEDVLEERPSEQEADVAEIETIVRQKQDVLAGKPIDIEQMTASICTDSSFAFSDPAIQKRCLDIVRARVRNVRDALQTRAMLEQPVEQGGLGMSGRQLADMLEKIEQAVDAQLAQAERKIGAEREAKKKETEERKKEEGNRRKEEERRAEVARVREVVKKTTQAPRPVAPAARPRVQDIQVPPRLLGPVDELRAMGLTEFRRLSKDPAQAVARIKDTLELLEGEGYHKMIEGVRSLQASPILQAYGAVTKKALVTGKSLDEIFIGDPQGLTKAEFQALMKLNAQLRF